MKIFSYLNYREYIRAKIEQRKSVRGYQGELARASMCQSSYFSKVLSGKVNLNPEQATRLSLFWQHSPLESNYFLELVHLSRTDFPPLKNQIIERLNRLRETAEDFSKRFELSTVDSQNELWYYSSWVWTAVHLMVGIPHYQSSHAISERLSVSKEIIGSCLVKLESLGLIERKGQRWEIKPGHFHLSKNSPLTLMNHMNWRQRAVLDSMQPSSDGIHFTRVQTHSHTDYFKLKQLIFELIDKSKAVIEPSEREEVTTLCIDFFRSK